MPDHISILNMTTPKQAQTLGPGLTAKASVSNRPSLTKTQSHSLFETIVFVDVGPERIRYAIHKGLLCSRSDYFKAALTGNFSEAAEQVVTLDDEDPEIFRKFNAWLYTDVLVEDPGPEVIQWSLLFNLYVFAEKRIIPLLQNAAIDEIIRAHAEACIPTEEIRHAWARTAETSPLRKLLVDLRLNEDDKNFADQFRSNIDQYDIQFVAAVAIRANELLTLESNCTDDNPDSRTQICKWMYVIQNPSGLRCERYHTHGPLEILCEKLI